MKGINLFATKKESKFFQHNSANGKLFKTSWILFTGLLLVLSGTAQNISTYAGTMKSSCPAAPCGDGGAASAAKLYSPCAVAVDGSGNVYIAEYSNHAVRKVDRATGIISTIAGIMRTGCGAAPCGDGGQATSANLYGPRGVTIGPDGNLYIADFGNHAIRKVDLTTGIITTVAGTLKSSCSSVPCGDGGLATNARLSSPTGIAFDAAGNMYIADYSNHVIRKVDQSTGNITTVAGTMKSSCSTAPCGDGGAATSAQFNGPTGVIVDGSGNIFITEYGNHSVRKVDHATGIISTYAGIQKSACSSAPCGDGGLATSARLTSPFSLAIDNNGDINIADASNNAIRKVDKTTNIITTVAGTVRTSCATIPCGDGGPATSAQMSNPFGIAFDNANNMFVVEYSNQIIRLISSGALPVTMTGLRAYEKAGDVQLSWKSEAETNVEKYVIERSYNGVFYGVATTITAQGNGTVAFLYGWTDHTPYEGDNYYRVKAVDKDGAEKYSTVVKVVIGGKTASLSILPNPVTNNTLRLQMTGMPAGRYELVLYNGAGQQVFSKTLETGYGNTGYSVPLPVPIPRGVYNLQVRSNHKVVGREKVMLQ